MSAADAFQLAVSVLTIVGTLFGFAILAKLFHEGLRVLAGLLLLSMLGSFVQAFLSLPAPSPAHSVPTIEGLVLIVVTATPVPTPQFDPSVWLPLIR